MKRLDSKVSNRTGFTLILSLMMMVIFIGAAAMAVDVSHAQLRRADVHAASDAAALAGIEKYAESADAGQALTEAQLFAGKFRADATALTVLPADFSIGSWDSTAALTCTPLPSCAFTPGGATKNAVQAIVRYTGNYTFGPVLGINSHASSATSVAVGSLSKSVLKSTCVAPMVMPMSALFQQLGESGKGNTDTLTASDVSKLFGPPADTTTFPLQNGSKVNTLNGVFYQVQLPPVLRADGSTPTGQSNSASFYRNAITCDDGVDPAVGVGDWLGAVAGVDATSTQKGIDNASGGGKSWGGPVTVEVLLTDQIGSPPAAGKACPCLHVAYVGAFTFTQEPGSKGVTGYFTALSPPSGGIVASGSGSSPLEQITKLRLVY